MSILNKYKRWQPLLTMHTHNQIDFVLSQDTKPTVELNGSLTDRCLVSYFDFRQSNEAIEKYIYNKCINDNNLELFDINLTGYDNGLLPFEFEDESYKVPEDCLLKLHSVTGYSGTFDYDVEYITGDTNNGYYALKGGFLQGFYKLDGFNYSVLPNNGCNTFEIEFVLRPRTDYVTSGTTLNDFNSGSTNGIFFYMGTRAENKFAQYYNDILTGLTKSETTYDGKPLYTNKYFEIETDNKYLFFNRTEEGFTTKTWNNNDIMVLTGLTPSNKKNYYTMFNRTENGVITSTYDKSQEYTNTEYDVMQDLKNNAFALKLNEDGSISYKYLTKDCNNESGWSIAEETTVSGLVFNDEWNVIHVRFQTINGETDMCCNPLGERKMKIYIYINGYLKLVSKELIEFKFRRLNDTFDKQETVPFNISLGGGTQGLIDSITHDGYPIHIVSYLEKEFAGSFIGDMRSFKFYDCALEYHEIKNNFLYEIPVGKEVEKYKIVSFLNENGAILQKRIMRYGMIPSYEGDTPTKDSDLYYIYTFNGWDKPFFKVNDDASDFHATYVKTKRTTKVNFVVYDEKDNASQITSSTMSYGETLMKPFILMKENYNLIWETIPETVTEEMINRYDTTFVGRFVLKTNGQYYYGVLREDEGFYNLSTNGNEIEYNTTISIKFIIPSGTTCKAYSSYIVVDNDTFIEVTNVFGFNISLSNPINLDNNTQKVYIWETGFEQIPEEDIEVYFNVIFTRKDGNNEEYLIQQNEYLLSEIKRLKNELNKK